MNGVAQSEEVRKQTDSLWNVWENSTLSDSIRLAAMREIIWSTYLFAHPDTAYKLARQQYQFARNAGDSNYMADAYNTIGVSFAIQSKYDSATSNFRKAAHVYKSFGNTKGYASSLGNIGNVYKEQGHYDGAIESFTNTLKVLESLGDKKGIAFSLGNIGMLHHAMQEHQEAIDYVSRSLAIKEELGNKQWIATSLNNLGIIYQALAEQAIEAGNTLSADTLLNRSMNYHQRSMALRKENGNLRGVSRSLNNIGLIYQDQGNYDKALTSFKQSLQLKKETGDQLGHSRSLHNIGRIYLLKKQYKKAIKHGEEALQIAQNLQAKKQIEEAAQLLYACYKIQNNPVEALDMYELSIRMRDSLMSEKNQKELIRQEYKYEYEKQAAADSIKAAEAAKVKDAKLAAERAENLRRRQQLYFVIGLLGLALLLGGFIFNRLRVIRKQKSIIEIQKQKVDEAYDILEEKNTEILDSINYARRIQSAILPPDTQFRAMLPDSFVLYKPKDIVAGDFYWIEPVGNKKLFAAADCTGHGVPGAMVSIVCNNGLNRSVREYGLTNPGAILDQTREIVVKEFEESEEDVKDGMDIALCCLEGNMLHYAGANNPLWIIRKGASELEEIKADRQPIGKFLETSAYTTHTVRLNPGDAVYIFSDGFADQFGGLKNKKFMSKRFKKLLLSVADQPMTTQKQRIKKAFEDWQGQQEQLDDVCVIGVRM